MSDLLGITLDDMVAEVRRECGMRREVYTRLTRNGQMNHRLAARRIEIMNAVLAYLEAARERERRS